MPTTILQAIRSQGPGKRPKEVTSTVSVTHNNARLYNHTDSKTYEFVGVDASANRIYRDQSRPRS